MVGSQPHRTQCRHTRTSYSRCAPRPLPCSTSDSFSSSRLATRAFSNWSVYAATKGALLSMARALAIELAPRGIRVNTVSPGPIDTPALNKQGLPAAALAGFRADMASRVPLGRIGSDDEIARTVAFLASSGAGYITGAEIVVDGGMFAGLAAAQSANDR
ncbi:SDR family oxidoreductase [Nonomuraea sp. NPDC049158]|uniref:SDR family oxidoreductase n=1 Tax=Nonomuraea sp. NPDC049158 TaxID=3155649 RepID=UPI0034030345